MIFIAIVVPILRVFSHTHHPVRLPAAISSTQLPSFCGVVSIFLQFIIFSALFIPIHLFVLMLILPVFYLHLSNLIKYTSSFPLPAFVRPAAHKFFFRSVRS